MVTPSPQFQTPLFIWSQYVPVTRSCPTSTTARGEWGPLENPQSHPRPAKRAALAAAAGAALESPPADVAPARRAAHLARRGDMGDAYVECLEN